MRKILIIASLIGIVLNLLIIYMAIIFGLPKQDIIDSCIWIGLLLFGLVVHLFNGKNIKL